MNKLTKVTITGADDNTDPRDLVVLSKEFPFVEWGILVSHSQEGSYRFPSRKWINTFSVVAANSQLQVSTHLCGRWVRELLKGELNWDDVPSVIDVSQRAQINTHASKHELANQALENFYLRPKNIKEFIFQWDDVNNQYAYELQKLGIPVSALFDTSGGAGILPETWPEDPEDISVGYAGGLGSDNVIYQVNKIKQTAKQDFWIDMERRVRSEDDSMLELYKVREVLSSLANQIGV